MFHAVTAVYFPRLEDDEVHVWLANLDTRRECLERLAGILSPDERERTTRFHSRLDASRWATSRVVLRSLLGRYLFVEPRDVSFQIGATGKPDVAIPPGRRPIQFNMSHSEAVGLYAVARFRRVGIDVERMRRLPDLASLARRIFTPDEQRALEGLAGSQRTAAFFRFWTRKEAYLKAIGQGLASVEEVHWSEPGRWLVTTLPALSGYAASLAIEGTPRRLRFGRWQERAA